MNTMPLDINDFRPLWQERYLSVAGWHFTREACEFAVANMYRKNDKGEPVPVKGYKREEVDEILRKYGVTLSNKKGYDYVFAANMCKADYLGESVPDEKHLALYVKNVIDDPDAGDGEFMRKWYAAMISRGIYVDWELMLGGKGDEKANYTY